MWFVRLIPGAISWIVLYLLFGLPLDVAKDLYVHPIADEVRELTGWEMPKLEIILSYITFIFPLLAVIATLYLYHHLYVAGKIRQIEKKYQIARPVDTPTAANLKVVSSIVFLLLFIPAVLYAGYVDRFKVPIPGPKRYTELRRLPDPQLRERAFSISGILSDLEHQYNERRREASSEYQKNRNAYDVEKTKYDKELETYQRAKSACPYGLNSGIPLFGYDPTNTSLSQYGFTTCQIPAEPTAPPVPSFPVVMTDPQWLTKATTAQEEAAAVWEELHHRFGGYVQFFTVPRNYNADSPNFSQSRKLLEDLANKLH